MGWSTSLIPAAREWYTGKLRALLEWASTASRPTSASGFRPMSCGTTAPTPSGCTTATAISTTRCVFELLRSHAAASGRLRPLGDRRRAEVPRALGRRLRGDVRVDGRGPSRRPVSAMSGGVLEPRHRRLRGKPDPALYKRWVAFGLLSTHSRLHGSKTYRVPWLFDEESVKVLRRFTRLKTRLMPYIFGRRWRAHRRGCR